MENKTEQEWKLIEKNLQGRRVWLYKPGEQGSKWGLMCELGLMGIGWSKLGDLRQYKKDDEIESKLNELYPAKNGSLKRINDKPANWDMCNTISKGDIIIAASGLHKLLGYGEVVGDYFYDETIDDEFASFRKVNWACSGEWHIDWKNFDTQQLAIKTLTEISDSKYKDYPQKLLAIMIGGNASGRLEIARDFAESISGNISLNLNQILYGPPGTGKTYNTIDKALEILYAYELIDFIPQERDEKKKIFSDFISDEQIAFVTFHQSYGYEDFVEGIKPKMDNNNKEKVEYEIANGIFKEICQKASENYKNYEDFKNPRENYIVQLDDLLKQYADYVENELQEGKNPKFESKKWATSMKIQDIHRLQNGDFNSIVIGVKNSSYRVRLSQKIIKRDYEKFKNSEIKDWNDIKPSYESKSHRHGNAGYYFTLYECIAEFEKEHYRPSTIPSLESTLDNRLKPYILIIDEINRGNISKILGELITLLEPSKRKGESEALEVKLPYSQEPFSVPNNLYIIGTMNTADRSIALLDTALRRRFEFIEMMPNSSRLSTDCDGVDLQRLLESINNRIEFLLDRERTIGHAFLIDVKNLSDLKAVFKNKILPLLQEYFYDDYAKINAVLNNNGMLESKTINNMKSLDEFVDSEKKVWKITDSSKWDIETFKAMYKNTESN